MSNLFVNKEASAVVTVQAVRHLTGITAGDFRLDTHDDADAALDEMLQQWIDETASNIRVRLGRQVDPEGPDGPGVRGVLVRTVANIVATAHQQRSSPVIQLGDFAARVMNTSEAFAKLDDELAPFKAFDPAADNDDGTGDGNVSVFWSSQPYEGD